MGAKKKKSRISLKWRLFAYFSVFTVILLSILWICQTLLLDSIYRQIKTDSLEKCTNEIAYRIKDGGFDTVEELARTYDVNVKIVDSDYEMLYVYAVSPTNIVTRISDTDIYMLCDRALENNGSYVQPFQQFLAETHDVTQEKRADEYNYDKAQNPERQKSGFVRGETGAFPGSGIMLNLISVKSTELSDGNGCFIIVDSIITPVNATVRTLAVLLMYISIFTVILALGLAFLLARSISNPIVSMNRKAKSLALGNYNVKFESRGYAEIEELNETMNFAAKELSRADELKNELIANVSHDLRTPLTMIIGYSEVMRDIPGENSPENVQVIIDEASRLSSLVNDLLDISRLQAGMTGIVAEEYNITAGIREIISRFDKLREKEGYEIIFEDSGDVFVNADEKRISQVIYNLIINAINYSGDDKRVTVREILTDSCVRIEVIDNGEGIAREDLPYIWDRYYRVDKTHKRAKLGTGLGLSIVKTVLEGHGAVYGVDSTIGVGSTFWFELERINKE